MKYVIIALAAYLLGSFCASIPLSKKLYGADVRNYGSGNAGATNVARVYGLKAGLLTLACDMAKTVAAVLLGKYIGGTAGEALAGTACIIGHCFPVYFGLRGGKGVSVGAALGLVCGWKVFLAVMAVFFVFAGCSKKVSLGSICAAAALPLLAWAFSVPEPMLWMCIFPAVLVEFMHRENIGRLLKGTEGDFRPKTDRK